MAPMHADRWSAPLVISKTQVKTPDTIFTPTRMPTVSENVKKLKPSYNATEYVE